MPSPEMLATLPIDDSMDNARRPGYWRHEYLSTPIPRAPSSATRITISQSPFLLIHPAISAADLTKTQPDNTLISARELKASFYLYSPEHTRINGRGRWYTSLDFRNIYCHLMHLRSSRSNPRSRGPPSLLDLIARRRLALLDLASVLEGTLLLNHAIMRAPTATTECSHLSSSQRHALIRSMPGLQPRPKNPQQKLHTSQASPHDGHPSEAGLTSPVNLEAAEPLRTSCVYIESQATERIRRLDIHNSKEPAPHL